MQHAHRQQTNEQPSPLCIFIRACDTSDQNYPCADRQHIPPNRHFSLKNASLRRTRMSKAALCEHYETRTPAYLHTTPVCSLCQSRSIILHQHITPAPSITTKRSLHGNTPAALLIPSVSWQYGGHRKHCCPLQGRSTYFLWSDSSARQMLTIRLRRVILFAGFRSLSSTQSPGAYSRTRRALTSASSSTQATKTVLHLLCQHTKHSINRLQPPQRPRAQMARFRKEKEHTADRSAGMPHRRWWKSCRA